MADNVSVLPSVDASAVQVATDDIGGVQHQKVKVEWGADGTATQTADADGERLPVGGSQIGTRNETAPATDTAASGLNGRLQRIAQHLTTLLGRWPAALGQTTAVNSLPVVLASNQPSVPVTGTLTTEYTRGNAIAPTPLAGALAARVVAAPAVTGVTAGQWGNATVNLKDELLVKHTDSLVIGDTQAAPIGASDTMAPVRVTHADTTTPATFAPVGVVPRYVVVCIAHATDQTAMAKVNVNGAPAAGGAGIWLGIGTWTLPVKTGVTVTNVQTLAGVASTVTAVSFIP